jgi:uncharacterized membrane protein YhhN
LIPTCGGAISEASPWEVRKDATVAGDEPVLSPDQKKPGAPRAARIGAAATVLLLLTCLIGNHEGRTEDIWLLILAGGLALALVGDWVLRRNGLR